MSFSVSFQPFLNRLSYAYAGDENTTFTYHLHGSWMIPSAENRMSTICWFWLLYRNSVFRWPARSCIFSLFFLEKRVGLSRWSRFCARFGFDRGRNLTLISKERLDTSGLPPSQRSRLGYHGQFFICFFLT